jgi:penicillin-binding protein
MYHHISPEAKETISKEAFVARYQNIYDGMEVQNLQVRAEHVLDEGNEKENSGSITFVYQINMDTIAGPIELEHSATLVNEKSESKKQWFIAWNPSLIFPSMEEGDQIAVQTLNAPRGEIRDSEGSGLAINEKASVIGIVSSELEAHPEQAIEKLAKLLEITSKEIHQALDAKWVKPELFVPIAILPPDETDLDHYLNIPGVKAQQKTVRTYPFGEATAHLIGYVREITAEQLEGKEGEGYAAGDMIGQTGLENVLEKRLKGEDGVRIFIKIQLET